MKAAAMLATAALVVAASSCNPYDPDLGDTPYRCGDSEPRCPNGYHCVELSAAEQLCLRDGDDGPEPFRCADDSMQEPNEDVPSAFPTPINTGVTSFQAGELAICPSADVDLFEFLITEPGTGIAAEIQFAAVDGALLLDLINAAGGRVATSTVVDGDLGRLRVELQSTEPALFYARVRAATAGIQNNYALRIDITPP